MIQKVTPDRRDLISTLLLMAYCLFLFRGAIFGGHLLFGSDFVGFYQGIKQFLYEQVYNHHSIPYWNPYVFGGMPFWAHLESTIFYPLDILFWFMAPEKAFGYTMFLHLTLAALFMYLLLKSFNTSPLGSFFGAVIFICNGFIMATLYDGQMFRVQAYIWLPLIIYTINRATKEKKIGMLNATLAGLFWGCQILSGSPQDALYTLMAVILFILFQTLNQTPIKEAIFKHLAVLFLFMVFGLGTAAIQVIPAVEFIGLSVRSAFDAYDQVTLGSYPLQGLITAIIPSFFGRYAAGDFWVSNVPWSIPLYNLYVGILPLMMLLFVPFNPSANRRIILFAGTLAAAALFIALGANTPLYQLIYRLPGFDRIRAPAKIIYLYVFALSLLAGRGMDRFRNLSKTALSKRAGILFVGTLLVVTLDIVFSWNPSTIFSFFSPFLLPGLIPERAAHGASIVAQEFHVITLISAAMVLIVLLHIRSVLNKAVASVLLCMLLVFDLAYINRGAIRYGDDVYAWTRKTRENISKTLGRDNSVFRVGSLKNPMGPNFEMYLKLQTVAGYNPLYLHRYYEYIREYNPKLLAPGNVLFFYSPQGNQILMDLLNVKYVISHDQGTYTHRESFLPRVFYVPKHKVLERYDILNRLVLPEFDPRRTVLLEAKDAFSKTGNGAPVTDEPAGNGTTDIVTYYPDEISVSACLPRSGFLFFSEIYYPGWRAFVDGKPVPLLRGDYIFRVVPVPAGDHTVMLVFDPPSIKLGIAITLSTLWVTVLIGLFHFFRRFRTFR